jgi:peptide/nickel transport system ATP-binding protein
VFRSPLHPYTRGLMDAFPSIKGERVPLTGIPGHPPDLARISDGCLFAPRCPQVMTQCETIAPPLYLVDGMQVRCLLYADGSTR